MPDGSEFVRKAPAIIRSPYPDEDYASIDFETQAVRNLRLVGAFKYMEDPHFQILCMGWAINDDEVRVWKAGEPIPGPLERHIARGGKIHAWNAMFERRAWMIGLSSWIQPNIRQWRCTMVRALACGLPAKLENAAIALRLEERKDMDGAKAMAKITKPKNALKMKKDATLKPTWYTPEEDPELFQKMYDYCGQDVVTERAVGMRLPYLSKDEEWQYAYDQFVADRGVPVDTELCRSAIRVAAVRRIELQERTQEICGLNPTQVQEIGRWVRQRGVDLPDLKKVSVSKVLNDPKTPKDVREVLQCRREAGKTSVGKYERVLQYVCLDGTVKGLRQFNGAHTGRWAGRGPQFDNLMRPTMKNIDDVVSVVKTGESWLVESAYDNVMEAVANSVRSVIVAPTERLDFDPELATDDTDNMLFVGDFKSIESRNLAFTSGQQSTLDQWQLSDEGKGPDVYVSNAADMFNVPLSKVSSDLRYWGKISELSLGYEGGVGALFKPTGESGARFRDIYEIMHKNASEEARDRVNWLWGKMGRAAIRGKEGVNEKDWRAARYVVERWRAKNPMSVKLWRGLLRASVEAVKTGKPCSYRGITYRYEKDTQFLYCKLMSGRELKYPFAHLVVAPNMKGEPELQLRAYYYNDKVHRFVKYHPYGGFLTENVVQAQSRDIMASRFKPLEKAGYHLRHTVHDEIITSGRDTLTVEEFIRICTTPPKWAVGMPIAMEAWSGVRYKKQ